MGNVSVKNSKEPQYTVYLCKAKVYMIGGKKYRRGDAFTGTKEECEHLLNQKQYGERGEYIWSQNPPANVKEGRITLDNKPQKQYNGAADQNAGGDQEHTLQV
jgi:hypothetical protein